MNHLCYKTIFSKRLGALVAVGEHACSQSKGQGARAAVGCWAADAGARFVGHLAVGFLWVGLAWSQTLPQGAQVVQGSVGVSQSGNQMSITQGSAKAVVNWQSFDIGQNAKVTVLQPSSQSVLLNRVLSDNPTQILGQLQANGQVVLVNPKGIVVGSDGSVSASGFTASTLNIDDADFMAGASRFVRNGATGAVVNKGLISVAPGGYVALLGATVQNEGRIVAPMGAVVMGAADAAVLPEALTSSLHVPVGRTGKIKLELTPATVNAWVKNDKSGVIVTEGGQVYMQAAAVHGAVASVFQSGRIDTSAAQAGDVHLLADRGRIVVDGQITANSTDAQRQGGDIVIGRDLETGVLAASTDVSAAQLESQRGFVETSGYHLVVDGVQVKAGQWLLDPTDITITTAEAGMSSSGTNPITQTPNTSGTTASTVSATTLASSLSAGTSVVVKTTNASGTGNGDITVASNIAVTGSSDATLTLQAERDIVVNTGVNIGRTGTNKLNVVLNSDLDGNGTGTIQLTSGSAIKSNGGNITLGGGSAGNGSGKARGYSVTGRAEGILINSATVNAGGGNIAINGQGSSVSPGGTFRSRGVSLTGASSISTTGAGNITLDGQGGVGNDTNVGVGLQGSSTLTGSTTGAVTISGTGGNGGHYNFGVWLDGSKVTTTGGSVTVNGVGAGSGGSFNNDGVMIQNSASLGATGAGTVTVTGTGGGASNGGTNHGVEVFNGGIITSGTGAISVTGTNTATTLPGYGIAMSNSGKIISTGNASITLTTDSFNSASTGDTINAGTGQVTIQNKTAGISINVGGADVWTSGSQSLGISDAELDRVTGKLTIGQTGANAASLLTVSDNLSPANASSLSLLSGGDVIVAASKAITMATNGHVVLNSDSDGSGAGAIVMNTGSAINSNGGNITLGGGSTGDGSGNARGNGTNVKGIQLSGATLSASGGNLALKGQGFAGAGKGDGISMSDSVVNTTGAGTLNITGVGAGTDTGTTGVDLLGATTITGGSTGAVVIAGSNTSTGTSGNQFGVRLKTGDSTKVATVTSLGGSVTVIGSGGGAGAGNLNHGVRLEEGLITAGAMGTVSVTGTGGTTTGTGNHGVVLSGSQSTYGIRSSGGTITVTGVADGSSGGSTGINVYGSAQASITSGSNADVILVTDSLALDGGAVSAGSGTVTVKNRTAGTLINVGGTSTDTLSGTLKLDVSSAELARITASTTVIGRNDATGSGALTAGLVDMGTMGNPSGNLTLLSGANILVSDNINKSAGTDANLSLKANGDITVAANKSILSTSNKLNVLLNSDSDASGAGGIILNSSSGITSNGGSITMGGGAAGDGSGFAMGNPSGSGFFGAGVQMFGANVNSGAGNILINGKGNLSNTGIYNYGVFINSSNDTSSGTGSQVKTTGGNITINGTGGGAGASYANVGIQVDNNSAVSTQGSGVINLTGTGGSTSTGGLNNGLYIARGASMSTVNGDLNIVGTGAPSTAALNQAEGIYLVNNVSLTSTGTGNINITGTGGQGGNNNNGVRIDTGTANSISAASGNVAITATAGAGGGSYGLTSTGSTNAIKSTTGNVTVTSDSMNWDASTSLTATAGTVTLQNKTAGTLINVGGSDVLSGTPLTLGLSSTEYGRISAANTVIGRNDAAGTGTLTVSSAVSMNTMGNLTLLSSASIAVNESINKTAGADANLTLKANDNITMASGKTLSSTSNKLNVVLNSDADASNSGAIRLNTSSSISSNGGSITLGGGSDASGYAVGSSTVADAIPGSAGSSPTYADGILLNGANLLSAGGNISLKGKSSAGTNNDGDYASAGVRLRDTAQTVDINSGAGKIAIDGISQSTFTGGNSHGVHIGGYGVRTTIQSSSSEATAIDIKGIGAANSSNVSGIFINGTASVIATGAGGIALTGEERRPTADGNNSETGGVFIKNGNVLSTTGQIAITGISNLNHGIDLNWSGGTVGSKTGTAVPSSSANIVLTSNNMWLGNTSKSSITTSGNVTAKTITAATSISLGGADVTGASGTLGLDQNELDVIAASNLIVGSSLASNIATSTNITTATTSGNVTFLTSGNIAVNNTLSIGGATATKTLTMNAMGATSTVTDGPAGAIKATNLELLGATAAYTLDSATNAISTLAGNTGSVTLVDSLGLTVASVKTINSTNSSTGTVGLTTTGNINLSSTSAVSGVHGILLSNAVTATGSGSISLSGSTSNALGVNLASNVSANTGAISITGTSATNVGLYVGKQVSSKGAIALNGTGANIGVNIDSSASVVSLANGSDFAGSNAISITGTATNASPYAGVLIRNQVSNNSSNGATSIQSTSGNILWDQAGGTITNASTAGAINIAAGNGTSTSSAGISAVAGARIVQNANADVLLTTDGTGNLTSPKIVKNSTGAGDIVLAAGKLLAAGVATGGQVKPVSGNSVTNSGTGSLFVYSGSPTSANTAALSLLDSSLADLYLTNIDTQVQNTDANVAYATSGVRNTIAGGPKAQVLFREKVNVGTINGATVSKTYGDANTGSTETASLWNDMATALRTANATSGVSNVNSTSTTAGTLKITNSAIVESFAAPVLQSTSYSTTQKLKAKTTGSYVYATPSSNKYTTGLKSGQSATVTVGLKALTPSANASNKVYDANTTATVSVSSADILSGDLVTVATTGGAFDTKNVGTSKTVTASGISISGTDAANYSLQSTTATTTARVTAKAATVNGTATSTTYNGQTQTQTAATSSGFISGDDIIISGASTGKNAGTYTSNLSVGGSDAANYSATITNADMTIAKADLTVAMSAQTKTYDGTTSATLASGAITATGVTVNGVTETASVSQTVGTFNNKNVTSASSVSATLASGDFTAASGTDLANYNLPTTVSGAGTITAKSITATAQANDKVYDATNTATLSALGSTGVVSGDTVTFSQTGASFADRHVAKDGSGNVIGKTVTVSGITIAGTHASNYALDSTSATTTAKITPKALTLAAVSSTKTYDGITSSTGSVTATGLVDLDTVSASQSFASKDVLGANGSTLQVNSGFTVNDGNSGNNYSVSTTTATGTITKANLTVTANADAKFVTQADATGYNGASYSGLVNGEDSTVLGGTLSITRTNGNTNVAAGTYAGSLVASGLTSGNYNISYSTGDYKIIPAGQLLIRTTNVSTVYGTAPTYSTTAQYLDGSNVIHTLSQSGTGNNRTFSDGVGGSVSTVLQPFTETAGVMTAAGQSSAGQTRVGNYSILDTNPSITGSNFTGAPVYVGNLTVTPKALTATMTASNKVYDGGVTAQVVGSSGDILTGDKISFANTSATFNNKNVGTGKAVAISGITIGDADAANYTLQNSSASASANISKKDVTLDALTATNKTYDGSTTASITAGTLGGTVGNETLSVTGSGSFDTKDAGTGKTVTVSNVTALTLVNGDNGGDWSNYNLTTTGSKTTTAEIMKKDVTLQSITAASKTYDGTTDASITAGAISGTVGTETLAISGTGSFDTKNAGTGKTVTVSDVTTLTKANGSGNWANYNLTTTGSKTTSADMARANLTLSGSRVYDASTTYAGQHLTASGVNGETFALTGAGDASNLSTKNVQTHQVLNSVSGLALGASNNGGLSGNYTPLSTTGSSVSVTPKALTAVYTANDQVYNGNTAATVTAASSDIVSGDTVTLSHASATFDNKNVGTGKTVSISGIGISGTDAANYNLQSTTASATANITPKGVTLDSLTAASKTYDGSAAASITAGAISGTVTGETLAVSGSGSFDTKNAGTGKTVTVSDVTTLTKINGTGNWANYTLTTTGSKTTTADIARKDVTLGSITASNKTYDGTTAASITAGVINGTVGAETLSVTGSGSFDTKNAGSGKTVTVTNVASLSKVNGSNGGEWSNYNLTTTGSQTTTANIAKKDATINGVANQVTYNASTQTQDAALLSGFIASDVTAGTVAATGLAAGRNAGRYTSNLSAIGTDAGNYNVTVNNADLVIGQKSLVLAAESDHKTYDGTTVTKGKVTALNLAGSDTVTASQSFVSKDALGANGSTLQVDSGYTIHDGNNGNNYSVRTTTATGTIDKANLTVTANADARFVTQADTPGYNGASYSGWVNGETSTVLGGTLSINRTNASTNTAAGTYAGTLVASGLTSGNYNISFVAGDYTIVPARQLLIRTQNVTTVYGTAPTYSTTAQYLDGSNVIQTLSQSGTGNSMSFVDGAGGSVSTVLKPYTGAATAAQSTSGHTVVGNYAIQDGNPVITGSNFEGSPVYVGTLTVTPKQVVATANGVSKVYDGTTRMGQANLSLSGKIAGDILTVTGSGAFSQKDVGQNLSYAFSNMTLQGADRANYVLQGGTSISGNNGQITPAPLTFSGTKVSDKTYDGNTTAQVVAGSVVGLVGDETLTIDSLNGQFETPTVGKDKPVNVVYGLSNGSGGGLASNYTWSPVTVQANIVAPLVGTVPAPAPIRLAANYSRLTYQGFGGLANTAAATGLTHPAASSYVWATCSPQKLESCICEESKDGTFDICYPEETKPQQAQQR
ncbi:YDG domain-containing protein [Limnohabitans sp. 63ED37-2]|uniref:YDG domain-containing protein n=1 Tax=Limnohabitans sp. 63ED37-2 TaxID=1678128 RepID=UPI000706D056|nr:YDG domain-containing protein [Limnohabitans sp. 63ED37-2]ALK89383.1 Heme/hemopexin-binding protein precursor [Limnohabitans sp. 63ED37-2]